MSETAQQIDLDFFYKYASLFTLGIASDYLTALQGIYGEEGNKYIQNKCADAEQACIKAQKAIERDLTKDLDPGEKTIAMSAVEQHKTLIYEIFSLDAKDQHRVRQLISKIKREVIL
jgi:hypothetical protein